MYMKFAGGILRYVLLVWIRNGCTESHFDSDSGKKKNQISTNKKILPSVILFQF